ncbi:MAG: hypothetical protein HC780_21810 [Leptolyngbyaceae cyanobacterium CSU_1_3]|nr:hypothetical protein [Leptolyngbyaceae cyanobacterium CSU_1_3]
MRQWHHILQNLKSSGAEFWLPLPLVGIVLWLGGTAIAQQVLRQAHNSPNQLQADTQLDMKLSATVLVISAQIDQQRNTTTVSIKTTDSNLKKLEYEFPSADPKQVEAAIAQEIGLPVQEVRKLVHYRIVD